MRSFDHHVLCLHGRGTGVQRLHTCVLWCFCSKLWDRNCSLDRTITRKVTQQELENVYIGPELFLDERYAQMLAAIFFSLTYSTALPLLVPLLLIFFVVLYWVDKFLFCRVYRTPPQYSWHLAARAGVLLPIAGLFHLAFGVWMLSNQDIIPPVRSTVL